MKSQVSIIIVHYHNSQVLFDCLNSINQNKSGISFEMIVVDNDETKTIKSELKRKFPSVIYLAAPGNLGYGAGINLGVSQAKAKYLYILNPDIIFTPTSLKPLVKYLDHHPKTAAVAPLLLKKNHSPYPVQGTQILTPLKAIFSLSFLNKLWPKNPFSQQYWINITNKSKPIPAPVLPGSAFLIRQTVFKKLNGFDQRFFLYFEESDLFKRLADKHYQSYILPQAKLVHLWAKSTPKTKTINRIFVQSRFFYLKKHFGLISALIAELFIRLSIPKLILALTLILAAFLRLSRLTELMVFISDQGRDYLAARDWLLGGTVPLVGIDSSVPWLKQGPLFIWLTALALKLGQFNPVTPAFFTAFIGILAVYFTYQLARKWFTQTSSLFSALIMATSALAVAHSRLAYHISPIPLLTAVFLLSLDQSLFWPCFWFSLLFQFELTTAPLILLIPINLWLKRQKPKLKSIALGTLGLAIPLLPKLIYDISHGWQQTLGFIAWLGYRTISFFGYSGRHTVSLASLKTVTLTIFAQWQHYLSWPSPKLALLIALVVLIILLLNFSRFPKPLLSFLIINLLAFYLHQAPSEAYFPVLFPVWAILIAWSAVNLKPKLVSYGLISLIIFINLYYLTTQDFASRYYGPSLTERLQLTRLITNLSPDQNIKLINPSPGPQFDSYLDNYRYLLWWQGATVSDKQASVYSIYQSPNADFIQPLNTTVYHLPSQKLIRYD